MKILLVGNRHDWCDLVTYANIPDARDSKPWPCNRMHQTQPACRRIAHNVPQPNVQRERASKRRHWCPKRVTLRHESPRQPWKYNITYFHLLLWSSWDFLLISMKMHATNSGGVAIQRMKTFSGIGFPDFEGSVCTAGDDDIIRHLGGPNAARVPY